MDVQRRDEGRKMATRMQMVKVYVCLAYGAYLHFWQDAQNAETENGETKEFMLSVTAVTYKIWQGTFLKLLGEFV